MYAELTVLVAKKPRDSDPIHPPTKCTPTTSRESSKPNLYFKLTVRAQTAPVTRPRTTEAAGEMKPQAGVIATRPATAPEDAPTIVGRPLIHSTMTQPSRAAAVAHWVLTNATAVTLSAVSWDPALNPNQPNHSRPAPSATIGTLCGRKLSFGHPTRLPSTIASASAADPALMCTAVPPAKSSAWKELVAPPMNPPPQIQCATGTYTIVNQPIANIIWKARMTYVGMPVLGQSSAMNSFVPRYWL